MGKKIVSVFLGLVLCFTNIIGVNASDYPLKSSSENDGYVVVSNESVSTSGQYTGYFNIDNSKYSLNKNLELHDYKIDVNLPFDADKNKDKLLPKKNIYGKAIIPSYKVGDKKDFYVVNFTNNKDELLNATLYYSGTKANVWVNNNEISKSNAAKLGAEFENNIHSKVTTYFGTESDIDNDGKINILCYDIKDGFSGIGGYVGGYFYARDLYNVDYSNKSEIFYIDTYPALLTPSSNTKDVKNSYETLAHEFQHMINFNQSMFKEASTADMDVWLNEGMSMAAEQVYTGKALTSRIDYYNNSWSIGSGHSLLYWDEYGDVLSNYSLSYLFLQYFKLQTGQGDAIFKELQELNNNNYKDIETLIKKYIDPNLTFGKFLTEFRAALLLKEPTGLRGFKGDPNFSGIKTPLYWGSAAYLRGGGAVVKKASTSDFEIPSNKGEDVTFTFIKSPEETNEKPTISGANDKKIKVGDSFNPREGIRASDKEDGDLTSKIQISGNVDATKSGKYKVTYNVWDKQGASCTKTITVAVYPKKAQNVKAKSKSYNSIMITWDKLQGVNGYEIYRSTSKNGTYSLKRTVTSGNTLSYTNTDLTTGKTYYYKVRGYGIINGEKIYGDFSLVSSAKPLLSKHSVTLSSGTKKVYVKWTKVPGASGYEIYRSTSKSGNYSKVKTITSGKTTSYTNSGLTSKKTYYYKVRVYRTVNGNKIYSPYDTIKYIKVK